MSRTQVRLEAPTVAAAGESFEVTLVAEGDGWWRATRLWVELVFHADLPGARWDERYLIAAAGGPLPPGDDAAGRGVFTTRLALPPLVPPTTEAGDLRFSYELRGGLELPWRLDANAAPRPLIVRGARAPAGAVVGARPTEVPVPVPGAEAGKSVSLHLLRDRVQGGTALLGSTSRYLGHAVVEGPPGAEHARALVQLEAWALPTIESPHDGLRWSIVAESLDGRARWPPHPVVVAPEARPARSDLFLGKGDVPAWWRRACWERQLHLDEEGHARGEVAGTTFIVWHRAKLHEFVAQLGYAPFEIELSAQLSSLSLERHGSPAHPEQVDHTLAQLRPALPPLASGFIADGDARFFWHDARSERVAPFFDDLVRVARALGDERRPVPPPAVLAALAPHWAELAVRLGGRFYPARFRIVGVVPEGAAEITTIWRGAEPFRTRVAVRPTMVLAVDAPLRLSWVHAGSAPAARPAAPRGLGSLLDELAVGAYSLEVRRDEVALELPPLADVAFLYDRAVRLGQLAGLAAALATPFR